MTLLVFGSHRDGRQLALIPTIIVDGGKKEEKHGLP
jgi:hypothetical protein